VFPPSIEPSASVGSSSSQASSTTGPSASKPLGCMTFVIIGKTQKKKADVTKIITELGGRVVPAVDKAVIACLSTAGELVVHYVCRFCLISKVVRYSIVGALPHTKVWWYSAR